MIRIYHTIFNKPFSSEKYNTYLNFLPADLKKRADRYLRWQSAHAFLLGKLVLMKGLESFGLNGRELLKALKYTEHKRPYLPGVIDFNITHSGTYVACAISDQCRVGLDIEKVEPRNLPSFKAQMTEEEWAEVANAKDPQLAFLYYWTKKEAAIKAHGRGMSLGLKEVLIEDNQIIMEGKAWPLYEIVIDQKYVCHLVTNREVNKATIQKLRIDF